MDKHVKSNIWKLFLYGLTSRRNFFPIIAIYFLTLPGSDAFQIGIYSAMGYIASFLMEIPSGYLADSIGHKKTLILSKVIILASSFCFAFGRDVWLFGIASPLFASSFAFDSGTKAAMIHNTLHDLKREKDFTKVMSRMSAGVSFLSIILILGLPLLTKINMRLPFIIYIGIDIIGLFISLTLITPKREFDVLKSKPEKLFSLMKTGAKKGFYPLSIFLGLVGGFCVASSTFRSAYLTELGFPIIWIGTVMASSRALWALFSLFAHKLEEKVTVKELLHWDLILYPFFFLIFGVANNPYVIGGVAAILMSFNWGKTQIFNNYLIKYHIKNPRYKATMLSIKTQMRQIVQAIIGFGIGFVMNISYKQGYLLMGIVLSVTLITSYILTYKHLK